MDEPWAVDQVEAAAPGASSIKVDHKFTAPGPWSEIGFRGGLSWGICQKSEKTPYRVSVDVISPAYECFCPSRKFPCKHAPALLSPWTQGRVSESGEVAGFASQWADARETRAARKTEPRQRAGGQRAAVAKRAT